MLLLVSQHSFSSSVEPVWGGRWRDLSETKTHAQETPLTRIQPLPGRPRGHRRPGWLGPARLGAHRRPGVNETGRRWKERCGWATTPTPAEQEMPIHEQVFTHPTTKKNTLTTRMQSGASSHTHTHARQSEEGRFQQAWTINVLAWFS